LPPFLSPTPPHPTPPNNPPTHPQIATDLVAQKLGVKGGALLQSVAPGGAAAAAGLLPTRRGLGGIVAGDAVLAVDGRPVGNGAQLLGALERYAVGGRVRLRVARMGDQVGVGGWGLGP